jgi:1-acyl-sn-glycerol-3-phosphate acyltransferase
MSLARHSGMVRLQELFSGEVGTLLRYIFRIAWRIICWVELALFTLLMYLLSFLPQSLLKSFYFPLFRFWTRAFVRALGVDLRLHQKNLRPLPQQYILIANHPSAFEDIGIPALVAGRTHQHRIGFPVCASGVA